MIQEQTLPEIYIALRREIIEAVGFDRVVFGVRGEDLAKPNISIFDIDEESSADTHDEDASLRTSTWQLTLHGHLPSDTIEVFADLVVRFSNKAPGPFQRTTLRGLTSYAEPEDNSHNKIVELRGVYNVGY